MLASRQKQHKTVLLDKLVKKFPILYKTARFIAVFRRAATWRGLHVVRRHRLKERNINSLNKKNYILRVTNIKLFNQIEGRSIHDFNFFFKVRNFC